MSFTRNEYQRLVQIARELVAMDGGEDLDTIAKELYDMSVSVIGQQSTPLFNDDDLV